MPKRGFTNIKEFQKKIKQDLEIREVLVEIGEKTYNKAKHIAHEGISIYNDTLAVGLDHLLAQWNIEEKHFYDFLHFIPEKIRKYSKVILPLLVMVIIINLPVDMSGEIKKTIALFACISLLWGFESIPMVITAILVPVLAVALGLDDQKGALASFSNPIIYLLFGGLVLAVAIRKNGLDRKLAYKLLSLSDGSQKSILLIFMLVSWFLGIWMSNTATIALLIPVAISIAPIIGKENKRFVSAIALSIGISSSIGGMAAITGSTPNAITAAFIGEVQYFSFFDWMRIGLPISVFCFFLAYITLLILFRIDGTRIQLPKYQERSLTYVQKKTLAIFILTILLWIFGQNIASLLGLSSELFSATIISLFSVCLLFTFNILDWSDIQQIPWQILLLIGGGLTLGKLLVDTGTSSLFADFFQDYLSGVPTFFLIVIIMYLSIFLANFVNNSSTVIVLVPTLIQLGSSLGINPIILALASSHAVALSFITPISIPGLSIIYGTNLVARKDMVRTGLIISLIGTLVVAALLIILVR
jgi:sodium-dependent dicarboxylate transporter 2/3/5